MYKNKKIAELNYNYDLQEKKYLYCCNICGGRVFTQVTHRDRYGYNASVHVCNDCGMVFLNPRMSPDSYDHFYRYIYRPLVSAYHDREINPKTVQDDQKLYTRKLVKILGPHLEDKNFETLLDVGGSTGIVALGLMEEYGFKTTLIDPAPAEVDEAKALGIESVTAFVEDWDPQGRKFDLVGIFQTIDHLLDVRGTLEKLRMVINEEGLMIFDIVDFRNAYLRHWDINEATKIDHPYYFTESSTEVLLKLVGFKTIHKVISDDLLHILFVCEPCTPDPDFRPSKEEVKDLINEIRFVQSTEYKKPIK
ncbi:class I SAM-dependent methyltransferase [Akkermansiaceae bacterium]|nr:class I SAM-dependent methyltransferase [Akkermansiaceae bacterium]